MRKLFFLLLFSSCSIVFGQFNTNQDRDLPENFPVPEILLSNDPAPGYFFLSPAGLWGYFPEATPYLAIIDNYGTPVFFSEQASSAFDFKLQNDTTITYAYGTLGRKHHILNDKFEFVKDLAVNGYPNDFHDLVILENGNYLMLANEYRIVDMDTVVEGGQPGVTVIGGVIQIQNSENEILFHWSTFDHFKITDAADHVDLTSSNSIDYAHINSIEQDSDSTIILSSRNMHELTKIDMSAGDIIWRLGGKNNMFSFDSDTSAFSGQHDFRKHENGTYSVFDNNWFSGVDGSRGMIYILDEENKNVTLTDQYKSFPDNILGSIMGNFQFLENGHWVVGWGSGDPNVTEFKADGTKAFEMRYDAVSYRAFKFDWMPKAITFNMQQADFGDVSMSQPSIMVFELSNNLQYDIEINSIHQHNDEFVVNSTLPINIPANEKADIEIQFNPTAIEGVYKDLMTFIWDTQIDGLNHRIAAQLPMQANATSGLNVKDEILTQIRIYPNPFLDKICIDASVVSIKSIWIQLVDLHGRIVFKKHVSNNNPVEISTFELPGGVYQLQLKTDTGKLVKKLIKL